MLYDPDAPEKATTIGHLRGSPKIVDGAVKTRPDPGVQWLLMPLAFVAAVVERLVALVQWLV